jgi:DNA-binding transcriptional LysR family regulator
MNLKFVEAFVWVARLRNITLAAEKLCLTQSAVSNRIAALEDELGAELINRRHPRFHLSDAGIRFMDYAEKLLIIGHEMHSEFGTPDRQPCTLRIGAIESVLHTWLIPMVNTLKRSSPPISFEPTIETTLNEFDALLRHDILTFQRGSHPHISLFDALQAVGIDDKHVHAISSISALTLLADSATLPRRVAERLGSDAGVRILETTLPLAPLPLHASYWNSPMNPVLKQTIRDAMAFARACAENEASLEQDRAAMCAARPSAPGTAGSDALLAESSASPGAS